VTTDKTNAPSAAALRELATEYDPGHSLPRAAYTSPEIFRLDMERVFATGWLFVAASAEVNKPNDHLAWTIGDDSVILSRGRDGELSAHYNVCRHRGFRLLEDGCTSSRTITCGYHAWAYGADGALRGAPHMGESFRDRRTEFGLRPVHVREIAGLIFVSFAADEPPLDGAVEAITAQLQPHRPERTKIAARHHYRVNANWKTLMENNRECYHCSVNHKEFCLSNYDLGAAGDIRSTDEYETVTAQQRAQWAANGLSTEDVSFPGGSFYRVARLPLKEGFVTESMSGELVAPLLGDLTSSTAGSVRLITLPNCWAHVNADYVMTTRMTPVDALTTDVDVAFLVHEDAQEGIDYDVQALTKVWTATSEQDWELCERNTAGLRSRGYQPGPLSPITENAVSVFHEWWLRKHGLTEAAEASEDLRATSTAKVFTDVS
jgi:Rieske 2Fe-2S family protein